MFAGRAEFCFDLHATLNAEWDAVKWDPVLPPEQVPSLVDEHGHFFPSPHVLRERPPRIEEILQNCRRNWTKADAWTFASAYERRQIVPPRYHQAERVRDRLPTEDELGW